MSARASAYAKGLLECPNGELISPREKLVLMVLADSHQDRAGRYTYPSVQTIAEDSMCDRRSCQRYLAALERKEVIIRMHPEHQGRAQITYYFFTELDEVPKGWQPAALSEHGIFLQKGGKRAVERAAKGRQNALSLNGTRVREPEPKQEQGQKQLPLIPLAGEGEANGGTREGTEQGNERHAAGNELAAVSASAAPRGERDSQTATGPADLAQVADAGSAAESEQDLGVGVCSSRDVSHAVGPAREQYANLSQGNGEAPQAAGTGETEEGVLSRRSHSGACEAMATNGSLGSVELGGDEGLNQEQLEHLAQVAPQERGNWEAYYREENAKAAAAAKQEQKPEESELEFADVAAARAWVMRKLGFLERRRGGMGPVVGAALRARAEQGESLGVLAQRMVEAVRKHAKLASRMRYQYGPAKFVSLGLWLDENTWPWDYKEIARQQARAF
jgi:hypothetical protein